MLKRLPTLSMGLAFGLGLGLGLGGGSCAHALGYNPEDSIAWKMARHDPLSPAALVGQKMFFDTALSGSGQTACATCHDPNNAYAPGNALAVQLGGKSMNLFGTRAVPSLRYKQYTPPYADLLVNPDGYSAPGPGGGFTQDGRAPTLADQAMIPLLAVNEMANKSRADVVEKISRSDYADLFRAAFGADAFARPDEAFRHAAEALQAFQLEDYSFHPFSSKYDLHVRHKIGGQFTDAEKRGLGVFLDPNKGNCAACHFTGAGLQGSSGLFTDYSYEAIGVPRNMEIPANRDRTHFDLGLCARPDHSLPRYKQYCGMFKTPTLRNVATRKVFFHNGQIKSLRDAVRFYNTRDTNPELWYPTVRGVVQKFNDLPQPFQANIDRQAPLIGQTAGSTPVLTEEDIDDLVAFLNTLTDDYEATGYHAAPAQRPPGIRQVRGIH
jgi:cytochrome c peroxidase